MDKIVEAFKKMPDKNLIVASGGVELDNIKKLVANAPNIKILGWVDEKQLQELVGNCIASIYIPKNEDFGMTAAESLAAGKPVVTCAEGGCLETVTHGTTGYICCPDPSVDEIVQAVNFLSPTRAKKMRKDCEQSVKKFSEKSFVEQILKLI